MRDILSWRVLNENVLERHATINLSVVKGRHFSLRFKCLYFWAFVGVSAWTKIWFVSSKRLLWYLPRNHHRFNQLRSRFFNALRWSRPVPTQEDDTSSPSPPSPPQIALSPAHTRPPPRSRITRDTQNPRVGRPPTHRRHPQYPSRGYRKGKLGRCRRGFQSGVGLAELERTLYIPGRNFLCNGQL